MTVCIEETTSERLKKAMDIKNMKQSELSRQTGIDKGSISLYLSGKYSPKGDKIYKLALALGVSPAWLSGFNVPMYEDVPQMVEPSVTSNVVTFPVIGEVAAGYEKIALEDWIGETVDIPASYLKGRQVSDYFVLTVKGNSMYPMYLDGDKVLILKQSTLNKSGDIGVILYEDENATLKKVEFVKGENWLKMIPINPEYQPRFIENEQLEHCRVLGIPKLLIREIEQ